MAQNLAVRILLRGQETVSKATQRARGALNRLNQRGSATFNAIRNAAIAAGGAIATYLGGRAIIGAFRTTVGEAADLEEAMARIQAVTGAADDAIDQLRQTAVGLGETTQFTAVQAAGAIENLGRAGLTTAEQIETVPQVIDLATASGQALSEAASTVTKTANAMGLAFSESKRIVDALVSTTQSANTNVRQLSQGFSQVAPIAKNAGLSFEETAGAVAKLQDAGLDATRAGTGLRQILAQLQDPTSSFSEALAKAGIETRNLFDVLTQLKQGGEGTRAAINAMSVEARAALELLVEQGGNDLRGFAQEIAGAEGAAAEAANTMRDTLRAAFEELGSAWNTLKRTIGQPVLEPVRAAVGRLRRDLVRLNEGDQLTEIGRAMADAFRRGEKAVRSFLSNYSVDEVISNTTSKIRGLADQFGRTVAVFRAVGNAIGAVVNTIQGAVAGVLGLIGKIAAQTGQRFLDLAETLNRLGVVSDETVRKLRTHVGAMNAAADATLRYGNEAARDAWENTKALADASGDLARGFDDTAQSADDAADSVNNAGDKADETATSYEELARMTRKVGEALEQDAAANSQHAVADALRERADAARQAAAAAKDHLDELRASGDATQQELRRAALEYEKAQVRAAQATERLARESGNAEEQAASLQEAMEALGVKTQQSLDKAAASARETFRTVVNSADASRDDVERAFQAYAEKAVKANQGIVSSELEATAAAHGLTDALEGMGEQAEASSQQAESAMDQAADAGQKAQQAVDDVDDAAQRSTSGASAALQEFIGRSREKFQGISEAAGEAFDSAIRKAQQTSGLVGNFLEDLASRRDRLRAQVEGEQQALADMQAMIERSSGSTRDLQRIASLTTDQFQKLSEQKLSGVRQAIQRAQQQLEQMRSSADDTLNSLQEELLQLQGREEELARRRNEQREDQIRGQLAEAKAAGDGETAAKLRESLRTLEKINAQELAREREKRQSGRDRRDSGQPTAPAAGKQTIELKGPDGGTATIEASEDQADALVEQLQKVGLRTE